MSTRLPTTWSTARRTGSSALWITPLQRSTYDAEYLRSSKNGTQLDFTSDGANATFVRNPTRGRVIVHETDARVISIDLKKDSRGFVTSSYGAIRHRSLSTLS